MINMRKITQKKVLYYEVSSRIFFLIKSKGTILYFFLYNKIHFSSSGMNQQKYKYNNPQVPRVVFLNGVNYSVQLHNYLISTKHKWNTVTPQDKGEKIYSIGHI